ncbi:serine hydrolase [Patescibacteria group bacterium]|nr:serine hydrolase [Patescibacteria group bacterium]MBU4601185.1 serine hydrolase [Patescibacteria group bacterium]MCG2698641.1 serine hydrolase [Candidatus Parcubacteria bacterium]
MWKKKAKILYFLLLNIAVLCGLTLVLLGDPGSALGDSVQADNNPTIDSISHSYHINLDQATIAKGYTVSAFNTRTSGLKLSLVPEILGEQTGVDMALLDENMEMPWQVERVSEIYQFEFLNKQAYDNHKPFYIQLAYDEREAEEENLLNCYKQIFFYDKNYSAWRPLPTKDYPEEKFVRSLIHLPFARIAVFSYPNILTSGKASWYAYKGGNFTASPDFPKGSRLRVYNLENNTFVDVEVNDYGPDRGLHPDRAVDLDKVAFSRLAPAWQGTIAVKVEPLYIASASGKVLGIGGQGALPKPSAAAKSAVIMSEGSGEILFEKNATSTLPIASLTKLAAIKTFLDTRPSLDRVVAYNVQDEEYNYEYCAKWESARLKVRDGDTMTIEDLLYASLVGSANNAIETLVRVSGLPRDEFIKKMNEFALKYGAVSTNFIEPTGLSARNVSSAMDYAVITKEIFTHPIIQKASTMAEYKFSTINTKENHTIRNTNQLISTNNFNITGSKTGYLEEAGYCLMTRAKNGNGEQVIAVILGADTREQSFSETEELLKYGLRKFEIGN